MQKKIQQMTSKTAERSVSIEKRESEENRGKPEPLYKARKRMGSPFGRFRERSISRERSAFTFRVEPACARERDRSEKQKDRPSIEGHTVSDHGNSSSLMWLCPQFRPKRRKTQ